MFGEKANEKKKKKKTITVPITYLTLFFSPEYTEIGVRRVYYKKVIGSVSRTFQKEFVLIQKKNYESAFLSFLEKNESIQFLFLSYLIV